MKRLFAIAALAGTLSGSWVNLAAAQEMYIGEIRLFGFNWCPVGWQQAAGQLLSINQNAALFSLYGTNFGGDGRTTFALPNLSGRAPYGQAANGVGQPFATPYGNATASGSATGSGSIILSVANMPSGWPKLMASSTAITSGANSPGGNLLGTYPAGSKIYVSSPADTQMAAGAVGPVGSGTPIPISVNVPLTNVTTQSPALSMNWCVATQGIFPSRQ